MAVVIVIMVVMMIAFAFERDNSFVIVDRGRMIINSLNIEFISFVMSMSMRVSSSKVENDGSNEVDYNTASSNTKEIVVRFNSFRMDESRNSFENDVHAKSKE